MNLENVLPKSPEWNGSRKIKLGNTKWLITFWCGALISESDITTCDAHARAEGIVAKWHGWCKAPRLPLVRGGFMYAIDGVSPVLLKQFLLPDGQAIYLRKEMFKFLPEEEEELTYFCIVAYDDVRAVLVQNAISEVIAIFSEIVPRGPVKLRSTDQ